MSSAEVQSVWPPVVVLTTSARYGTIPYPDAPFKCETPDHIRQHAHNDVWHYLRSRSDLNPYSTPEARWRWFDGFKGEHLRLIAGARSGHIIPEFSGVLSESGGWQAYMRGQATRKILEDKGYEYRYAD